MRSLYLHIPFCFHKCHYCDFYSLVDTQDRQEAFLEALVAELDALAPHAGPLQTIFVGGGTPTLLRPALWSRLLSAIDRLFRAAPEGREFTVECNPETATEELMATLAAGGVNRLSVGAQSFNERHLKTLERWHDPANVGRALGLALDAGIGRLSIDLIFAAPGQTLEEWGADLDRALDLPIEHLSCYGLTYEPGTAMTARLERGEFHRADESLEADMYELTLERLTAAGLARYEVSNFARPGAESQHNLVYWRGGSWLAAGPSASAHIDGWRWKNVPHLAEWMRAVSAGKDAPVQDLEPPSPRRAAAERLMMGLRLTEGIDLDEIGRSAGVAGLAGALAPVADGAQARGLARRDGARMALTDQGFLFADGVIADLIDAIPETGPSDTAQASSASR